MIFMELRIVFPTLVIVFGCTLPPCQPSPSPEGWDPPLSPGTLPQESPPKVGGGFSRGQQDRCDVSFSSTFLLSCHILLLQLLYEIVSRADIHLAC